MSLKHRLKRLEAGHARYCSCAFAVRVNGAYARGTIQGRPVNEEEMREYASRIVDAHCPLCGERVLSAKISSDVLHFRSRRYWERRLVRRESCENGS